VLCHAAGGLRRNTDRRKRCFADMKRPKEEHGNQEKNEVLRGEAHVEFGHISVSGTQSARRYVCAQYYVRASLASEFPLEVQIGIHLVSCR
jgi:hypothetical protein